MATDPKIRPDHLRRQAVVYVRQSTVQQVRGNRESTVRQYALADRAKALGWPAGTVKSTLSRALRRLQSLLAVEASGAAEVRRG